MEDSTPSRESRKRSSRKSEETPDLSFNPADLETPTDPPSDNGSAPSDNGAAPNPFDLESLRLAPDQETDLGLCQVLLSISVHKPDKSSFVRTHHDPAYHIQTRLIELKDDRGGELFLVARELWPHLAMEVTFAPFALYTAITRQGPPFIWPIKLPGSDGRLNDWTRTALAAADLATKVWVRVVALKNGYQVTKADNPDLPDPQWPKESFFDLLKIAFKDRHITTLDHPVLRQLRGEV
jgi:hypothetical protein